MRLSSLRCAAVSVRRAQPCKHAIPNASLTRHYSRLSVVALVLSAGFPENSETQNMARTATPMASVFSKRSLIVRAPILIQCKAIPAIHSCRGISKMPSALQRVRNIPPNVREYQKTNRSTFSSGVRLLAVVRKKHVFAKFFRQQLHAHAATSSQLLDIAIPNSVVGRLLTARNRSPSRPRNHYES